MWKREREGREEMGGGDGRDDEKMMMMGKPSIKSMAQNTKKKKNQFNRRGLNSICPWKSNLINCFFHHIVHFLWAMAPMNTAIYCNRRHATPEPHQNHNEQNKQEKKPSYFSETK